MQFIDLGAQQKRIREKLESNIGKVMDHGRYINGPEVSELEDRLADYVKVKHAVGCSSGTDALLMPLMAYGVGQGDAIFTTTFTFIATAEVIQLLQATPVFVDIDPATFNIDTKKLVEAIEKTKSEGKLNPRGIIPVDLFGQPADYDEIAGTAKEHGLFVLEDAAQGFGGVYRGREACSFGDAAATSFFPAKPLGCYGDGGMVFTNDDELYDKMISIRVHGKGTDKYDNIRVGLNGRLDTIQAAVLLAKFDIFEEEIGLRQEVASRYSEGLRPAVGTPFVKSHNLSAWAQYSVIHPDRDKIMGGLKSRGVPTAVYYPKPLHMQTAFASLGYSEGDFPEAESAAGRIFSLPMYPYLGPEEQNEVIAAVIEECS